MCPRPKTSDVVGAPSALDDHNGLWTIHGEQYDLRAFRSSHPGGSTPLDLCRGSDATRLFEQFHVMNDRNRAAMRKYLVVHPDGEKTPATEASSSPLHDELKAMVRDHFRGNLYDGHKASWEHLAHMGAVFAVYALGWRGWWRGDYVWGGAVLPVCAWLVMANFGHDGSHHAVSRRPWVNECALLTASPLLYS